MDRDQCAAQLVDLLQQAVDQEAERPGVAVGRTSPLIGAEAPLSSLALVSFIVEAELLLSEEHGLDVVLVSEEALSRSRSPFLTIDTLVDYIAELASEAA